MKKFLLVISIIVTLGCSFSACSSDDVTELFPTAQITLKDGNDLKDSVDMSFVAATKVDDMLIITATESDLSDGRRLLVYINGNDNATYPVDIEATSLLNNFNIGNIDTNTVVYYVSKDEYYLLVKGEITLVGTGKSMISGKFSGTMIPAHNLFSNTSLETILMWYDSPMNIEGNYRTYSVKF